MRNANDKDSMICLNKKNKKKRQEMHRIKGKKATKKEDRRKRIRKRGEVEYKISSEHVLIFLERIVLWNDFSSIF